MCSCFVEVASRAKRRAQRREISVADAVEHVLGRLDRRGLDGHVVAHRSPLRGMITVDAAPSPAGERPQPVEHNAFL